MIERASEFGASQAAPLVAGDTSQMTAGDMLREAREAHNLHIDVVAAALKVPTQKLQALEDDDIDSLPDPVFARALAGSVCRALKIDAAPVLAKLPGAPLSGLADSARIIGTNIRSGVPRAGSAGGGWSLSRPLMFMVALLLVCAAAVVWLPQSVFDQSSAALSRLFGKSEGVQNPDGGAAVRGDSSGTVVEPVLPVATQPQEAAPPAVASAPEDGAKATPAAPAATDVLVFVARADSWITVTQAGGKQVLRRTVTAGETVGISGVLPLSVVVGRASGVDVQVHGKPFDLGPVTKGGGVARFEVKS